MKSYIVLNEIKSDYLSNFSDEKAVKVLNENILKISDALSEDFKIMTHADLIVEDVTIYYDDEDFKQGATAYFLRAKLSTDLEYFLAIECLVDFNKIGIRARTEPVNSNLMNFHKAILSNYYYEVFAELRSLFN